MNKISAKFGIASPKRFSLYSNGRVVATNNSKKPLIDQARSLNAFYGADVFVWNDRTGTKVWEQEINE